MIDIHWIHIEILTQKDPLPCMDYSYTIFVCIDKIITVSDNLRLNSWYKYFVDTQYKCSQI